MSGGMGRATQTLATRTALQSTVCVWKDGGWSLVAHGIEQSIAAIAMVYYHTGKLSLPKNAGNKMNATNAGEIC